jgi:general secretion pathway protein B
MSYILDALKKAEQERKLGMAPDLLDNHSYTPRGPGRRLWLYALLIVFVIVAGGVGWYLGYEEPPKAELPFQSSRTQAVPDVPAPQPPSQPQPQSLPQPQMQKPAPASKPAFEPTIAVKKEPAAENPKPATETKQPAKPPQSQKTKKGSQQAEKAEQSGSAPETKPDPNKIYSIGELPEAESKGLPAFAISTHIYSTEPTERLASVNGNIGREGQEIMPGIILDSVLQDGVILKNQGYRFKVKLR